MKPRRLVGTTVVIAAMAVSACSESADSHVGSGPMKAVKALKATQAQQGDSTLDSLAGLATVRVPGQWHLTAFRGESAPVYFPLDFVSTDQLPRVCPGKITESCAGKNGFPSGWKAPANGVLVLWSHAEFPTGPALAHVSGDVATIDGRPAKVRSGTATSACPPGAATEIDAYVSTAETGERFDMTACFGPHATADTHKSVRTMLYSLRRTHRT